jgi:hypothetical protein
MSSIEFNGSLKGKKLEKALIDTAVKEINSNFHNPQALKLDIEVINEICNLIEDAVKSNNLKKINKLELFMKIHLAVFGVSTEQERNVIVNNVSYLHSNGKIKARSLVKKLISFLKLAMIKNG